MYLVTVHHFINETGNVTISSDDVLQTIHCNASCEILPSWTFETFDHLKLRVTFNRFRFHDYNESLEIGEGLNIGMDRLAHFSGPGLPSDVTPIINAAWIAFNAASGNMNASFVIIILAEKRPGKTTTITHP